MQKKNIYVINPSLISIYHNSAIGNKRVFPGTKMTAGFYETVQDFNSKKIKNAGEFLANDMNKVIFQADGKKTVYASRDLKDWGFQDGKGFTWRVYAKQNYAIIETGKIVVYAKCLLDIDKKDPNDVKVDAEQIYFSLGYDAEIHDFYRDKKETIKAIADWMRKDNPSLADKFEAENYTFFPKNVKTAYDYVTQFNDGIEKKETPRKSFKIKVNP